MIAGISATISGLRGANLGAAAVLLAGSATATLPTATVLALPTATVLALPTATAAVSLTGTAPAATMLPAAAVTVGRALPLGCTFHGVDERGCKYHSRRNKQ